MSCTQEIPARGKYFCMTATISLKRPGKAGPEAQNETETGTFDPSVMLFQYPYQRETLLPAKLTATQLKGRTLDEEIAENAYHTPYIRPLVQPRFRRTEKGLTPAERGTATHLVLQYLDLRNPNVPEQVERLKLEAKLTRSRRRLLTSLH